EFGGKPGNAAFFQNKAAHVFSPWFSALSPEGTFSPAGGGRSPFAPAPRCPEKMDTTCQPAGPTFRFLGGPRRLKGGMNREKTE
ncbi:MAG: hypothetical protein LBB66_05510, partial [Desulfovibrio sp.]|nr:hypothetical protein [Desulfovibrio sp.]